MGFVITVVPFLLFVVRRSTRGKRGATKSAEEEEEPEMSAECEPAAAASISESPPAALECMDLNVKPEPAETVPDSLSLELSSGSEEDRPRAKDDDNSAKSENDIVGTPVPNKKSTIKGIKSHRQLFYITY